jgi:hypothetical protein
VLPFPVELLRFLERSTPPEPAKATEADQAAPTTTPAARNGSPATGTPPVREIEQSQRTNGPISLDSLKAQAVTAKPPALLVPETAGSAQPQWGGLLAGCADPAWQP